MAASAAKKGEKKRRAAVRATPEHIAEAPEDFIAVEDLEAVKEAVRTVANRLGTQALTVVAQKAEIEERWLTDSRQYHGRYDAVTEAQLVNSKRSKLFVRLTS